MGSHTQSFISGDRAMNKSSSYGSFVYGKYALYQAGSSTSRTLDRCIAIGGSRYE